MSRAPRPSQSVPERSESVPERSGTGLPCPKPRPRIAPAWAGGDATRRALASPLGSAPRCTLEA
eukprot:6062470-Pyramimonas_sp.AAC.1